MMRVDPASIGKGLAQLEGAVEGEAFNRGLLQTTVWRQDS